MAEGEGGKGAPLLLEEKWDRAADLALRRGVYGALAGGAAALLLFRAAPPAARECPPSPPPPHPLITLASCLPKPADPGAYPRGLRPGHLRHSALPPPPPLPLLRASPIVAAATHRRKGGGRLTLGWQLQGEQQGGREHWALGWARAWARRSPTAAIWCVLTLRPPAQAPSLPLVWVKPTMAVAVLPAGASRPDLALHRPPPPSPQFKTLQGAVPRGDV